MSGNRKRLVRETPGPRGDVVDEFDRVLLATEHAKVQRMQAQEDLHPELLSSVPEAGLDVMKDRTDLAIGFAGGDGTDPWAGARDVGPGGNQVLGQGKYLGAVRGVQGNAPPSKGASVKRNARGVGKQVKRDLRDIKGRATGVPKEQRDRDRVAEEVEDRHAIEAEQFQYDETAAQDETTAADQPADATSTGGPRRFDASAASSSQNPGESSRKNRFIPRRQQGNKDKGEKKEKKKKKEKNLFQKLAGQR